MERVSGCNGPERRVAGAGGGRGGVFVCLQRTLSPHAVIEAALAHAVRNKAEAAYARSDLFEKRHALMESCSEYRAA